LAEVLTVVNDLQSIAELNHVKFGVVGRIGVAQILAGLWAAPGSEASLAAVASAFCKRLSNDISVSMLRCPELLQHQVTSWNKTPTHKDSMRAVKRALDPKDILNRGRFVF
jgi:hypothetical protein